MALKPNAQQLLDRRLSRREEAMKIAQQKHSDVRTKMLYTLRKLLSGEQITAEDGREFFWEFVANSHCLRGDAMTGNAQTYYKLGERKWAEYVLQVAKDINIDLFQKMEREAIERREMEAE